MVLLFGRPAALDSRLEEEVWVKTPWTPEQLTNQSVEYRFPRGVAGGRVDGQGKFVATASNAGVSVVIETSGGAPGGSSKLHLVQTEVDAIKPAPPHLGIQFTCYLR